MIDSYSSMNESKSFKGQSEFIKCPSDDLIFAWRGLIVLISNFLLCGLGNQVFFSNFEKYLAWNMSQLVLHCLQSAELSNYNCSQHAAKLVKTMARFTLFT